jgi:hypothetical protein
MWLVVAAAFAIAASVLWLKMPNMRKKYKLGFLALMLWGMAIMVFVDKAIAYLEGEEFLETSTDGLIADPVLLGFAMLAPAFLIWAYAVLQKKKNGLNLA